MLEIPDPDLRALAGGETIVAFVERANHGPGAEATLIGSGPRPGDSLKPAYRRWADAGPPPGTWVAVVEEVHPAVALDAIDGVARHILVAAPESGDLLVLRVFRGDVPVLSDEAFAARVSSLEAALG